MGFVSTLIDLSQGILFVESPRCKERLQITLESNVYEDAIEDIELYGQRYTILHAKLIFCILIKSDSCKDVNEHTFANI